MHQLTPMTKKISALLQRRQETLGVAESSTGGLVSAATANEERAESPIGKTRAKELEASADDANEEPSVADVLTQAHAELEAATSNDAPAGGDPGKLAA